MQKRRQRETEVEETEPVAEAEAASVEAAETNRLLDEIDAVLVEVERESFRNVVRVYHNHGG